MTVQELHDMLTNTTNALKAANHRLGKCYIHLHDAKTVLTSEEYKHTLAGLEGKNEAARRAELAALTEPVAAEVARLEEKLREAQLAVTIAQLDHQLARNLLRLHTSHQEANDAA